MTSASTPSFNPFYPQGYAQQLQLQRNQALAAVLQQQSMDKIDYDPNGAISPFQGLNKIAQGLSAGLMNKKNDANAADYMQKMYQNIQGAGSGGFPSATGNTSTDMAIYNLSPEAYAKALADRSSLTNEMKNVKDPTIGPAVMGGLNKGAVLPDQTYEGRTGVPINMSTGLPIDIKPPQNMNPNLPALIKQESGGNPNAVSPAGAQGLTQVMPATGQNPGFGVQPLQNNTPEENVRFGNDYLNAMEKRYGDPKLAAAAYNAGPGAVDKVIAQLPKETQDYVPRVTGQTPVQQTTKFGADPLRRGVDENLKNVDKARLDVVTKQADSNRDILGILDTAEGLIKQGTLGNTPSDRLQMIGHDMGLQTPQTINTANLMKIGNQLVLARGSLGTGVSTADAARYDAAAGDFSKAKSNEERTASIKVMREIGDKYLNQANNYLDEYRRTGKLPEYHTSDSKQPSGGVTETRNLDGKTYFKINGQWHQQ